MSHEFNPATISLVILLGNPGDDYTHTYHNVARIVFEPILEGVALKSPKTTFAYGRVGQHIMVIPQTFMNESGHAVHDALSYFKHTPNAMVIIHDDADLEFGDIRTQFGRGSAGHNGVQSIIDTVGTNDFWRIRIGIRKEIQDAPRIKARDFVLDTIPKNDIKTLSQLSKKIEKILGIVDSS